MAFTAQNDVDTVLIRGITGSDNTNPTQLDQDVTIRTHAGVLQSTTSGSGLGNSSAARASEMHVLEPQFRDGTTPFGRFALEDFASKSTPVSSGGNSFTAVDWINSALDTSGTRPFVSVPTGAPTATNPRANTTVVSGDNATNVALASIGADTAANRALFPLNVATPFTTRSGFNGVTFALDTGRFTVRDRGLYQVAYNIHWRNTASGGPTTLYHAVVSRTSDNKALLFGAIPQEDYVFDGTFVVHRLSGLVFVDTVGASYELAVAQNSGGALEVDRVVSSWSKIASIDPNPL